MHREGTGTNSGRSSPANELSPAGSEQRPAWLFVLPWNIDHTGGVNQVVRNLVRECERDGRYRPLVLTLEWSAVRPRRSPVPDCTVVGLRVRPLGRSLKGVLKWILLAPIEVTRLRRLLAAERVAVVNWHYPTDDVFSVALLRKLGLFRGRLILSFHGKDLKNVSLDDRWSSLAWRCITTASDAASACSRSLASELKQQVGDRIARVALVYNGIDVAAAQAEAQAATPPAELIAASPYLLNLATYEHKKGQDVLIRAFASVANEFPKVRLVLMGRDDGLRSSLAKLASELGIASRVLLLPPQAHDCASAACRGAVALVVPSRIEPFGLVVIEAAALGTPVIAARVGGIPEIVEHEVSGLLTEPDDVVGLSDAIRRILSDAEMRQRLAAALRANVEARFSIASSFRALSALAS